MNRQGHRRDTGDHYRGPGRARRADQAERDFELLTKAIELGKVKVETGV